MTDKHIRRSRKAALNAAGFIFVSGWIWADDKPEFDKVVDRDADDVAKILSNEGE